MKEEVDGLDRRSRKRKSVKSRTAAAVKFSVATMSALLIAATSTVLDADIAFADDTDYEEGGEHGYVIPRDELIDREDSRIHVNESTWRSWFQNRPDSASRYAHESGQWVDTDDWEAVVTYVHYCVDRNPLDPEIQEGFGVDDNDNPYTNTAVEGIAAYSFGIHDGIGGVNGRSDGFGSQSFEPIRTDFGELANEVNATNEWNGKPRELFEEATGLSETPFISSRQVNTTIQNALATGGVANVNEQKMNSRIAATEDEQRFYEERLFECGFDFERRGHNDSADHTDLHGNSTLGDRVANRSEGTLWFADHSYLDELADPENTFSLANSAPGGQERRAHIAKGREDAILEFSEVDFETGQPFAYIDSRGIRRIGVPEAWQAAGCYYSPSLYPTNNRGYNAANGWNGIIGANNAAVAWNLTQMVPQKYRDNPREFRGRNRGYDPDSNRREGSGGGFCGIRGVSGNESDNSYPQISHQKPFTELTQILWSYRYWDRESGEHHSIFQSRTGGSRPAYDLESHTLRTSIWLNMAEPDSEGSFSSAPPEDVEDEGAYIESIAHSEGLTNSYVPHKSYQIMHALCNGEQVREVVDTVRASTHTDTDRSYSTLATSQTQEFIGNEGEFESIETAFGTGSLNPSQDPNFYSRECEFDAEETVPNNHIVSAEALESNTITMLRDNTVRSVGFGVEENPELNSGKISNVNPAYTIVTRDHGSVSGNYDMLEFRTGGDEPYSLFRGNDTGGINLTNSNAPVAYSSQNIEVLDGFVNNFDISSSWASGSEEPELFNVSYAWSADLQTVVPERIQIGDLSEDAVNYIENTENRTEQIIGRTNISFGEGDEPSGSADIVTTSGEGIIINNDGSVVDAGNNELTNVLPADRFSSNSFVVEFIRNVRGN